MLCDSKKNQAIYENTDDFVKDIGLCNTATLPTDIIKFKLNYSSLRSSDYHNWFELCLVLIAKTHTSLQLPLSGVILWFYKAQGEIEFDSTPLFYSFSNSLYTSQLQNYLKFAKFCFL